MNLCPPNQVENNCEMGHEGGTDLLNFQAERAAQRKPAAFMLRKKINFLINICFPV